VDERQLINRVHRVLSSKIYRWKINDSYHGGVPDTYYSGHSGLCFVEYKYKPKPPKKDTSLMGFKLSDQQELWLTKQHHYNVPVYVLAGCEENFWLTQDFKKVNACTKERFNRESFPLVDFVLFIEQHCLGRKNDAKE